MSFIAKWLILIGIIIAAGGVILLVAGNAPFLGRLPGDVRIERRNFTFYFPIVTCIILSILLTLILWIVSRLK